MRGESIATGMPKDLRWSAGPTPDNIKSFGDNKPPRSGSPPSPQRCAASSPSTWTNTPRHSPRSISSRYWRAGQQRQIAAAERRTEIAVRRRDAPHLRVGVDVLLPGGLAHLGDGVDVALLGLAGADRAVDESPRHRMRGVARRVAIMPEPPRMALSPPANRSVFLKLRTMARSSRAARPPPPRRRSQPCRRSARPWR